MVSVKSGPNICTLTACYKFDLSLDYNAMENMLVSVFQTFDETNTFVYPKKMTKTKSQVHVPMPFKVQDTTLFYRCRYESYCTKSGAKRGNFLNQTCFYYITSQNKKRCFKFFRNGLVHVTGFNDITIMDTATLQFFQSLMEFVGDNATQLRIVSRTINLLNMNLKLSHRARLEIMALYFQRPNSPYHVFFEPEIYVGLMLSCREFKIIIFRSGSVIITGTKSVESAMAAYERLVSLISETESKNLFIMAIAMTA